MEGVVLKGLVSKGICSPKLGQGFRPSAAPTPKHMGHVSPPQGSSEEFRLLPSTGDFVIKGFMTSGFHCP